MTKTYCDACKDLIPFTPIYFTIKSINTLASTSIEEDVRKVELCADCAEKICNLSYSKFNEIRNA